MYVGTGVASSVEETKPREQEFWKGLHKTANQWRQHNSWQQHQEPNSTSSSVKIKILMDARRARRKVIIDSQHQKTHTCSAETVLNCISNHHSSTQSDQGQNPNYGVYLFHVHPSTQYLLPSPINEAVGVFHMKAYVINDALILSGANLSEEYLLTVMIDILFLPMEPTDW
jgi:hypothetical protein